MFEKLGQIEKKFYATEAKLSDPAVISDMAQYTALMKEYSSMKPVVDKYQEYKAAKRILQMHVNAPHQRTKSFASLQRSRKPMRVNARIRLPKS